MANKSSRNHHHGVEKDYYHHNQRMYRTSYKYRNGAPAIPLWLIFGSIAIFGGIISFIIFVAAR